MEDETLTNEGLISYNTVKPPTLMCPRHGEQITAYGVSTQKDGEWIIKRYCYDCFLAMIDEFCQPLTEKKP